MRTFWNINVKLPQRPLPPNPVCLWQLGAPPPDPHVITPAYYCKFIEFISCTNCILLLSKDKITAVNVLLLLLLHLSHLFFISNSI